MDTEQGSVELELTGNKAAADQKLDKKKCKQWKKPVLEDVSGKVMAQPYIRFT